MCINSGSCFAGVGANGEAQEEIFSKEKISELISRAEAKYNIPVGLLAAIAKTESGMNPYALNIKGKALTSLSKTQAAAMVREQINQGIRNIDIGIMQVNWRWHGVNFTNVEEMLDLSKNIDYAAKLLGSLYKQHNNWHKAVRYYHSATGEHHKKYSRKVILCWLEDY